MDGTESYEQRLPFDHVHYYSVFPQKSLLKMVEIARFSGGPNEKIFVIANDIDAGNNNLGRTEGIGRAR